MARIAVYHATEDLLPAATALARELNLPLHDASASYDALLHIGEQGLSLVTQGPGAPGPLSVDFADPALLHRRRSGHNEPLGRALGVHKWPGMSVVDATAGLGRESFVIADLGARVTMLEKHPAVFA
ncbi:MAG: class I SAM-dependent methyltransferase, partial [Pseudomonadota bacterium]